MAEKDLLKEFGERAASLIALAALVPLVAAIVIVLARIWDRTPSDLPIVVIGLLLVGFLTFAITRPWVAGRPEVALRRQFLAVTIAVVALVPFVAVVGPLYSRSIVRADVGVLVHRYRWIGYDPAGFDPAAERQPSEAEIARELGWIRRAGFDGVITFGSGGILASIPRLAKQADLKVIMGIWDPNDPSEVARALGQQRHVDAYCVGHNGLNKRYQFGELEDAVDKVRFYSWRPVTTTEPLQHYLDDERLREIGDWVFPDLHLTFEDDPSGRTYSADVATDVDETFELTEKLAAAMDGSAKPVLLKMITYPVAGIPGASRSAQASYFSAVLGTATDPYSPAVPKSMALAIHGAFDQEWKVGDLFRPWDPHTGVFDSDGTPRPAVRAIRRQPL